MKVRRMRKPNGDQVEFVIIAATLVASLILPLLLE